MMKNIHILGSLWYAMMLLGNVERAKEARTHAHAHTHTHTHIHLDAKKLTGCRQLMQCTVEHWLCGMMQVLNKLLALATTASQQKFASNTWSNMLISTNSVQWLVMFTCVLCLQYLSLTGCFSIYLPHAGSGVVRIDPLYFLAGRRTRWLNQV